MGRVRPSGRSTAMEFAVTLLVIGSMLSACSPAATGSASSPAESSPAGALPAGCAEVPGEGQLVQVGSTPVRVVAPEGWQVMLALGGVDPAMGPDASSSQGVVVSQHDPHLTLNVLVEDAEWADEFATMEDPPTGSAVVNIRGIGPVSVDRIVDGSRAGMRYLRKIGSEAVRAKVLGPDGTCDATFAALLGLVVLPR